MQSYPTRSFVSADSIVEEAPEVGGVFLPKIQREAIRDDVGGLWSETFLGSVKIEKASSGCPSCMVLT